MYSCRISARQTASTHVIRCYRLTATPTYAWTLIANHANWHKAMKTSL